MSYKKLYFTFALATITMFFFKNSTSQSFVHPNPEQNEATMLNKMQSFQIPERITFWAEHFIGTPYDTEPIGIYVKESKIVVDDKVDCMYLTFRSIELAHASTPEEALDAALDVRFLEKGQRNGNTIISYKDRFQYGEDMAFSNKYGRNVTSEIGKTTSIPGSRHNNNVSILKTSEVVKNLDHFKTGDIVFLVKNIEKRKVGEIVEHIGILKKENGNLFLIHASGTKGKHGKGKVEKVFFDKYLEEKYPFFIGVIVTRF